MVMTQQIKNVVLVHGAFADGSGWEAVATILKNDGYKVSVVQHPETSYAEDQKYTKAAIDAMDGPVVLVGHSYGGSVITEAGNHPQVAALVYIAAFALDEGESCASIEQGLPTVGRANFYISNCGDLRPFQPFRTTGAASPSASTTLFAALKSAVEKRLSKAELMLLCSPGKTRLLGKIRDDKKNRDRAVQSDDFQAVR